LPMNEIWLPSRFLCPGAIWRARGVRETEAARQQQQQQQQRSRKTEEAHRDCNAVKRAKAPEGISVMLIRLRSRFVVEDGYADRSGKKARAAGTSRPRSTNRRTRMVRIRREDRECRTEPDQRVGVLVRSHAHGTGHKRGTLIRHMPCPDPHRGHAQPHVRMRPDPNR
jgi:hypothetical protein